MPSEEIHSCIPKPSIISLTGLEFHLASYSMTPHGAQKKRINMTFQSQMSLEMPVVGKIHIMDKFKTHKLGNMAPLHKAWCHDCEKRTIVE